MTDKQQPTLVHGLHRCGGLSRPGRAALCAALGVLAQLPLACSNSPYPEEDEGKNILYRDFRYEIRHMDPAQSYSAGDYAIVCNVLEPPFQYHYLKRPYELIPLLAAEVPTAEKRTVTFRGERVDATVYTIRIKAGVRYHDHPCFVKANRRLSEDDMRGVDDVWDIKPWATQEVEAADFVLGIRRLADPRLACPLYPTFAKNLLGLAEYRQMLTEKLEAARAARKDAAGPLYNREQDERYRPVPIDYADGAEAFPFVRKIDAHTFEIVLKEPYPQILYWMALPFFAPVPREAIEFFSQRPLLERNISFDKNMVGTGAYVLREFDPTNQIVLERNPNFHPERYPNLDRPRGDASAIAHYEKMEADGMLDDAGKPLPLIDRVVFRMEKESIPRWNKFLQGYYDHSGIQSDLFDQAVTLTSAGQSVLTDELKQLDIRLLRGEGAGFYFYAFNMNDPVVGGYTDRKRKLRQAVSIAFDTESEIAIFANGQAVPAHGPIPPGIFGHERGPKGINPVVYEWKPQAGGAVRRSLDEAKALLAEAGYPRGRGPDGQPLTIRFVTPWSSPAGRSRVRFVRKQFDKLGIRTVVETSDDNRFNQKVRSGSFQFVHWGWSGDYPDPENFLFLFYAPDPGDPDGRTVPKYYSEEFNRLFHKMKAMPNSPDRLKVIRRMLAIIRNDAPAIFASHPERYGLYHDWYRNTWPNAMALNALKYHRVNPVRRAKYRRKHNAPRWWPVVVLLALLGLSAVPAARAVVRRIREA